MEGVAAIRAALDALEPLEAKVAVRLILEPVADIVFNNRPRLLECWDQVGSTLHLYFADDEPARRRIMEVWAASFKLAQRLSPEAGAGFIQLLRADDVRRPDGPSKSINCPRCGRDGRTRRLGWIQWRQSQPVLYYPVTRAPRGATQSMKRATGIPAADSQADVKVIVLNEHDAEGTVTLRCRRHGLVEFEAQTLIRASKP